MRAPYWGVAEGIRGPWQSGGTELYGNGGQMEDFGVEPKHRISLTISGNEDFLLRVKMRKLL